MKIQPKIKEYTEQLRKKMKLLNMQSSNLFTKPPKIWWRLSKHKHKEKSDAKLNCYDKNKFLKITMHSGKNQKQRI